MTTEPAPVAIEPPASLVEDVKRLKAYCPYRICWGAFKASDPTDTFTGADYDKRKLNAKLRAGYLAFIVS